MESHELDLEARRKAQYDSSLHKSRDECQQFYCSRMRHSFAKLREYHSIELFGKKGWLPLVMLSKPIYPTLVARSTVEDILMDPPYLTP